MILKIVLNILRGLLSAGIGYGLYCVGQYYWYTYEKCKKAEGGKRFNYIYELHRHSILCYAGVIITSAIAIIELYYAIQALLNMVK